MNVLKTSIAVATVLVLAGAVSPARAQLAKATLIVKAQKRKSTS